MEYFILFVRTNAQLLLLGGLFFVLIMNAILYHQIKKVNKKLAQMTNAVKQYISAVMEEETVESGENISSGQQGKEVINHDEENNRLISLVLQEMFP